MRPGNRGGLGLFQWEDIKSDKQKSHYLGVSTRIGVNKWGTKKDDYWYGKQVSAAGTVDKNEIVDVKARETEAMLEALGMKPKTLPSDEPTGPNPAIVARIERELETSQLNPDRQFSIRKRGTPYDRKDKKEKKEKKEKKDRKDKKGRYRDD